MTESEVLCLGLLLGVFPIPLPINVVDSALVEFPSNTAVTDTTNRTKFRCRSDELSELEWFMQANNTDHRQTLAFGYVIKNEQAKSYSSIENEEAGKFTLILSIQDESAQTYTCQEPDTNQERSAELIIMKPIKFEKSINESHVILKCSVNFRGNWAPELELSHNGTSVLNGADVFVAPNQNVSTTLVVPRHNSAFAGSYSCTTRFHLRGKPGRTTDNSVPSYMDTSTFTVHMEEIHSVTGKSESGQSNIIAVVLPVLIVVLGLLVSTGVFCFRKRYTNRRGAGSLKEIDSGHSGQQDPNISTGSSAGIDSGRGSLYTTSGSSAGIDSGRGSLYTTSESLKDIDSVHSGQQNPNNSTGSSAGIDSGRGSLYTTSGSLKKIYRGHSRQQNPNISTGSLKEIDRGHSGQQNPNISTGSSAGIDSGRGSLYTTSVLLEESDSDG